MASVYEREFDEMAKIKATAAAWEKHAAPTPQPRIISNEVQFHGALADAIESGEVESVMEIKLITDDWMEMPEEREAREVLLNSIIDLMGEVGS